MSAKAGIAETADNLKDASNNPDDEEDQPTSSQKESILPVGHQKRKVAGEKS